MNNQIFETIGRGNFSLDNWNTNTRYTNHHMGRGKVQLEKSGLGYVVKGAIEVTRHNNFDIRAYIRELYLENDIADLSTEEKQLYFKEKFDEFCEKGFKFSLRKDFDNYVADVITNWSVSKIAKTFSNETNRLLIAKKRDDGICYAERSMRLIGVGIHTIPVVGILTGIKENRVYITPCLPTQNRTDCLDYSFALPQDGWVLKFGTLANQDIGQLENLLQRDDEGMM